MRSVSALWLQWTRTRSLTLNLDNIEEFGKLIARLLGAKLSRAHVMHTRVFSPLGFLGLYRDPVVAQVTRRCDWRIADLAEDRRPTTRYLVVWGAKISRPLSSLGQLGSCFWRKSGEGPMFRWLSLP